MVEELSFHRAHCLKCPPQGDLPDPEIEPVSLRSPILAGSLFTTSATWEAHFKCPKAKGQASLMLPCSPAGVVPWAGLSSSLPSVQLLGKTLRE